MFHFLTLCPCPHLTHLILNPYYPLKLPTIPQPLPAFMQLHTLTLAIRDGYSRNPIIEVLDRPLAPKPGSCQAFASFLTRSGCLLHTLRIIFTDNAPTLLSNLRALPSLTHFTIIAHGHQTMRAVDSILQWLTLLDSSDGDTRLLPNLTSSEL
ncbi:hypothetical protein C8R44DRAFT_991255 [Mycena epipterygia]|nr:hypothetical protein C8R44DRAFT_991255 [Mycena epipterygia]